MGGLLGGSDFLLSGEVVVVVFLEGGDDLLGGGGVVVLLCDGGDDLLGHSGEVVLLWEGGNDLLGVVIHLPLPPRLPQIPTNSFLVWLCWKIRLTKL